MALKCLFDQYAVNEYDFGRQINFKIYSESDVPYDCTFATGNSVAKTFDSDGNQLVPDIAVTWDTQSSGIGHFSYTQASRVSTGNVDYYVVIQMWNTAVSEQLSTEPRRIVFLRQPSTN